MKSNSTSTNFKNDYIIHIKNSKIFLDLDLNMKPDDVCFLTDLVEKMSKDIYIDGSYVNCQDNNHEDVFIESEGWNNLCSLLDITNSGKDVTELEQKILAGAVQMMGIVYIKLLIELYGFDTSNMNISYDPNTEFSVEYSLDIAKPWKKYPGKWQDW